ncbi:MAG TPA: SIMPL domain-containing protein [Dehalococcoidia bacterium]|nr:SIMPL domain-containing protein [Dehalococcoidia bacterium]
MRKGPIWLVILVALAEFSTQQQVGLWVSGLGKVRAVPDIAVVDVGVEAQATTVSQAMDMARTAMNQVMAALSGHGVASQDIQTRYFNISPVRRWDERRNISEVIGYRVTNSVTAKIRNIKDAQRVGRIIDAVAEAGGDLTRIGSLRFTIEDPKPFQAQARAKAIQDALAKAQQMTEAAGVELGKLIYITEVGTGMLTPRPIYFKEVTPAPPEEPTPFSPGEEEITVSVRMVFDIA